MSRLDRPRRPLPAALLVGLGFVLVHLLLLAGTFDVYDLEETEYGNVAVALLDGQLDEYASLATDPATGDGLMTGAGRRRRTVWSIEPTVLPVFAVLGPTMFALKTWAILLGGLWAALWFGVGRAAFPRAPALATGLLFVLPTPLVQRAAISATSIPAHLGSSLWQAAALLAALAAVRADGSRRLGWALGSGLLAGLGLHGSFSLAPLLVAPLWLLLGPPAAHSGTGPKEAAAPEVPAAHSGTGRRGARGGAGLLAWGLGVLPGLGLVLAFRDPSRGGDLITALTGLQEGGVFREAGLARAADTVRLALTHGAGFGRVDPETLDLAYLPLGAVYALLVFAILGGARLKPAAEPAPEARLLRRALHASFAAFALVLLGTGFKLEPGFFDGLRYLLPLAPLPVLLVLSALERLDGRPRSAALLALLLAHALGFALLFRPAVFPAPWAQLRGFEPWVMKAWLQDPLRPERIHPDRLERWALWAGISEAQQRPAVRRWADLEDAAARHGLEGGEGSDALWRGVGFGLVLRAEREGSRVAVPRGTPRTLAPRLLEGMAMGSAHVGCSEDLVLRLAGEAPDDELRAAVWTGAGRADLYCRSLRGRLPEEADAEAFERGTRDAFRLDYAWGPVSDPPAWIDTLRVY